MGVFLYQGVSFSDPQIKNLEEAIKSYSYGDGDNTVKFVVPQTD